MSAREVTIFPEKMVIFHLNSKTRKVFLQICFILNFKVFGLPPLHIKIIFGLYYFISKTNFQNFCSTFYDFWVAKRLHSHIFLVVFLKSEILKNAVSERWCTDSMVKYALLF